MGNGNGLKSNLSCPYPTRFERVLMAAEAIALVVAVGAYLTGGQL